MIYKIVVSWIMILIIGLTGCSQIPTSTSAPISVPSSEIGFLNRYGLEVNEPPLIDHVQVPADWQVKLGEFPIGLYWGLANEFSKDAGLDLTHLKGKRVEAHIYELKEGLAGSDPQIDFKYPSKAILIVENGQVAGAWLTFNVQSIGPSVKKRSLTEITGLSFEEWANQEHYFEASGINSDLVGLSPTQVIDTFFDSINQGDKVRAAACLSPQSLLESLTRNMEPGHLYNESFKPNNSLAEAIVCGKPLEFQSMYDPQMPINVINELDQRREVGIRLKLEIEWKHPAFNSPDREEIRFAIVKRSDYGWKIDGLGTGP